MCVTPVPTALVTPLVTVPIPSNHRQRTNSARNFNAVRFRLRQQFRPDWVCVCCLFCFFPRMRWDPPRRASDELMVRRVCLPRARRPEGRQSLVRAPAPASHGARRESPGMKRPQPPGARPAEYRRPAWRPGRFAVSRHRGAITNTRRPGYRTAEPSDSPPRASRYARHGGGACRVP